MTLHLGGGFRYFLFLPLFGEMIQFDQYFSNGLKPPIRHYQYVICTVFCSISWLFFQVQKPWWVINPDSNRFSHAWQVITNFALAFVALVTPLQVGLLEIRWDALFFITWCVDLIFMIDMVLQFVTMYPKTTARGLELEFRPCKIAKHYIMTWFFLVS